MDALLEPVPLFKGHEEVDPSAVAALVYMHSAETAADLWWDRLDTKGRKAYLKAHPRSKYGKSSRPAASSDDTKMLHSHMKQIGWIKTPTHWEHPNNGRKMVLGTSPTHKHVIAVTHPNGDTSKYRTNQTLSAMRTVTNLAKVKKKNNAGIGKVLGEKQGSLHKHLGVPHGHPLPLGKLEKLANSGHPLAGRARMVLNLKRARKRGRVDYAAP